MQLDQNYGYSTSSIPSCNGTWDTTGSASATSYGSISSSFTANAPYSVSDSNTYGSGSLLGYLWGSGSDQASYSCTETASLEPDGTWGAASGSGSASGGSTQDWSYTGSGSYSANVPTSFGDVAVSGTASDWGDQTFSESYYAPGDFGGTGWCYSGGNGTATGLTGYGSSASGTGSGSTAATGGHGDQSITEDENGGQGQNGDNTYSDALTISGGGISHAVSLDGAGWVDNDYDYTDNTDSGTYDQSGSTDGQGSTPVWGAPDDDRQPVGNPQRFAHRAGPRAVDGSDPGLWTSPLTFPADGSFAPTLTDFAVRSAVVRHARAAGDDPDQVPTPVCRPRLCSTPRRPRWWPLCPGQWRWTWCGGWPSGPRPGPRRRAWTGPGGWPTRRPPRRRRLSRWATPWARRPLYGGEDAGGRRRLRLEQRGPGRPRRGIPAAGGLRLQGRFRRQPPTGGLTADPPMDPLVNVIVANTSNWVAGGVSDLSGTSDDDADASGGVAGFSADIASWDRNRPRPPAGSKRSIVRGIWPAWPTPTAVSPSSLITLPAT